MLILKVNREDVAGDYVRLDLPGGGSVGVKVLETGGRWARLGFDAPAGVKIRRRDVVDADGFRGDAEGESC